MYPPRDLCMAAVLSAFFAFLVFFITIQWLIREDGASDNRDSLTVVDPDLDEQVDDRIVDADLSDAVAAELNVLRNEFEPTEEVPFLRVVDTEHTTTLIWDERRPETSPQGGHLVQRTTRAWLQYSEWRVSAEEWRERFSQQHRSDLHAQMSLENPAQLLFSYCRTMFIESFLRNPRVYAHFTGKKRLTAQDPLRVLILGSGGAMLSRALLRFLDQEKSSDANTRLFVLDMVDHDRTVVKVVSQKLFSLNAAVTKMQNHQGVELHTHIKCGADFVAKKFAAQNKQELEANPVSSTLFDVIWINAFDPLSRIPPPFQSGDFLNALAQILSAHGTVAWNLRDSQWESGLKQLLKTTTNLTNYDIVQGHSSSTSSGNHNWPVAVLSKQSSGRLSHSRWWDLAREEDSALNAALNDIGLVGPALHRIAAGRDRDPEKPDDSL